MSNDTCPITLESTQSLGSSRFILVAPNMLKRGYCGRSLAEYYLTHSFPLLKDPESKCDVTSTDLRRLQAASGIMVHKKWLNFAKKSCDIVIFAEMRAHLMEIKHSVSSESPCSPLRDIFFNTESRRVNRIVLYLLVCFHSDRSRYEGIKNDLMHCVLTSPCEMTRTAFSEWVVLIHLFEIVSSSVTPRHSFTDSVVCLCFSKKQGDDGVDLEDMKSDFGFVSLAELIRCRDHIIAKLTVRLPMLSGVAATGDPEMHEIDDDDDALMTDEDTEDSDDSDYEDEEVVLLDPEPNLVPDPDPDREPEPESR